MTSFNCKVLLLLLSVWQWCTTAVDENLLCYSGVNGKIRLIRCDSSTEFCYKQVIPNGIVIMDCDRSNEFGFCKNSKEGCEERSGKGKVCCCSKPECNASERTSIQHNILIALLAVICSDRFFCSL